MLLYRGRGRYSDALTLAHTMLSELDGHDSHDASIRALKTVRRVALSLIIAQLYTESGSTAAALV